MHQIYLNQFFNYDLISCNMYKLYYIMLHSKEKSYTFIFKIKMFSYILKQSSPF